MLGMVAILLTTWPQTSWAQTGSVVQQSYQVYLPLVQTRDNFDAAPALWAAGSSQTPPTHEVALLRCTINLGTAASRIELDMFADTRYEVWLNGRSLGRGPTRFSQVRREYDTFSLGDLVAGQHVIAVLGQWAPNLRRSESSQPEVQARLRGSTGQTALNVMLGPEHCRAIKAAAWRSDPVQIHIHNILGPSEQLDLRSLPQGWQQPSFMDAHWPQAMVQSRRTQATYQARSIPLLANVAMPFTLREAGQLMPGFWVGELTAETGSAYQFGLAQPTNVTLMALEAPRQPVPQTSVYLNDQALTWHAAPGGVPDLRRATINLPAGQHQLSLADLSSYPEGWVFAISQTGINSAPPPLGSSNNPGRRMLIPELVRDSTAAFASAANVEAGQNLVFTRGATYAKPPHSPLICLPMARLDEWPMPS